MGTVGNAVLITNNMGGTISVCGGKQRTTITLMDADLIRLNRRQLERLIVVLINEFGEMEDEASR